MARLLGALLVLTWAPCGAQEPPPTAATVCYDLLGLRDDRYLPEVGLAGFAPRRFAVDPARPGAEASQGTVRAVPGFEAPRGRADGRVVSLTESRLVIEFVTPDGPRLDLFIELDTMEGLLGGGRSDWLVRLEPAACTPRGAAAAAAA